jgi:hypothetical protein
VETAISGSSVALKYPKYDFQYANRVGDVVSTKAGLGGDIPIYSASFDTVTDKQDYDLQDIISTTSQIR